MKIDMPKYWEMESGDIDFDDIIKYYQKIVPNVDYEECGQYIGDYYAIFWVGRRTKEVQRAIDNLKKELKYV